MDAVMPYDDPTLKEFDNYYQARSASQRARAENWAVAVFAIKYLKSMRIKATNELKNRHLLVGLKDAEKGQLAAGKDSCQKKVVRKGLSEKGCQKTADKLIELLKAHPSLTQAGMSNTLGISRQAIQKHLSNLKKAGRLRRIGPDKGGHWEVIEKA